MLYIGGDCSQSDNIQEDKFFCEDRNGGPPTEEGASSYIVVTDIKGKGVVYFSGFVQIGQEYPLDDGGNRFEADQFITVYSSDDTTESNILQFVQYHSSCSSNLQLKNRFGAHQLTGFYNTVQGNITCFATANFGLQVQLPLDVNGSRGATLTSMTLVTNFVGSIDLTEEVAGAVVEPGGSTVATVQGVIDLTERKRYTILAQMTGIGTMTQSVCTGSNLIEFFAGSAVSPGTATNVPTQLPSISLAPLPDVATTACELDATILCSTLRNPDPSESSCTSLALPSQPTCISHGRPSRLSWLYNGMPCSSTVTKPPSMFKCTTMNGGPSMNPPDDAFISVISKDKVYFAGGIRFGSTFLVSAGSYDEEFAPTISIVISQMADGEPGQTLQTIELHNECQMGNDIHVLAQHGAVQLVAFESKEQGLQSALEELTITYVVQNIGPIRASLNQIYVNSTFTGERNFASLELEQGESERWAFTTPINLYASDGLEFYNEIHVEGTGLQNNIVCSDEANLDIMIG